MHTRSMCWTSLVEIGLRDLDAKGVDTLADRHRLNPDQCAQLLVVRQDNQSVLQKVREREEADIEHAQTEVARAMADGYIRRRIGEGVWRSDQVAAAR